MKVSTEMYGKLFNAITDAENDLEKIVERLKQIQIEVEKLYINSEDDKPFIRFLSTKNESRND